jgi:hypothetical protein
MGALLLTLLLLANGGDPPSALATAHEVRGLVTDADGAPLSGVLVFAVDPASDRIVALASSDDEGRVTMQLRALPHNFGIMSVRHGVQRLIAKGAFGFTLVLRPLPEGAATTTPAPDAKMPVIRAGRATLVRGRVVDEAGHGLAGVRVDAVRATEWRQRSEGMRATGQPIATAISGAQGEFALAIPGGDTQLQARAPGLALVRSAVQQEKGVARADRPILVMGVATDVQSVTLREGRVLRVRLQDSIDPAYSPPAPLRAWLLFAYGICSAGQLLRAQEKQGLKPYWYLDVLREEPPNPATISTSSCTPPSQYGRTSLSARIGLGAMEGFDDRGQ